MTESATARTLCRLCLPAAAAIALLLMAGGAASSDQLLELQLRPPGSGETEAPAVKASSSDRSTARLPYRGVSSRSGRVGAAIGKVGFVEADTAHIRRSRSPQGPLLFSVSKGTPLAVINTSGNWYGVLMSDGSTGWVPASDLRISDLKVVSDVPADSSGVEAVRLAYTFSGVPYVWGGASRAGMDCSGFVKTVWEMMGRKLPRTAREQALVGEWVDITDIQPGDRLYFNCKGGPVDHTGIYVGNGMFIHASSSRGGVGVDPLNSPKYRSSLVCIRRG